MAPTELLAAQHTKTLVALAEAMPLSSRPRVACLSSSLKPAAAKALKAQVAAGDVDLLVGTHALINVKEWKRLGFVVVDEQHK
jgi:ATP-dependent DNA helicase RecG